MAGRLNVKPVPDSPSGILIHNEKIKLTTAWLNTLGAAAIAAGVIAPIVASIGVPGYSRMGLGHRERDLASGGDRLTFSGQSNAGRTEIVTVLQIYSFFVLPVLVLAIGAGMYWLNARETARFDRERQNRH